MDPEAIRAEARLALEKYGSMEGLNASQQMAVEGATSNRLTLVQGACFADLFCVYGVLDLSISCTKLTHVFAQTTTK